MTNEEKRYVANEIIQQLNDPFARCLAQETGKGVTVQSLIRYNFEGVDDLLEGDKEDISKMVQEAARGCAYPDEQIPSITVKLTFEELLELSDIQKGHIETTMITLGALVEVMQDNEDERTPLIGAVLTELRKLTKNGALLAV